MAVCGVVASALPLPSLAAGAGDRLLPATPLSFEQARELLLRSSDALAAADANVGSKRDLAEASRRLRLPEISLDARQVKFRKSLELPLGELAPLAGSHGLPGTLHYDQQDWRFRPSLTATLPLYTGGQIPAVQQAAAAAVQQAEAEKVEEGDDQVLQLVQVYFGQQLAEQVLDIRGEVRDGLQRHLDDAEKLERGGFATKAQRLQATVARDQAEREYQRARSEHDTMVATLSRLLHQDRAVATITPVFIIGEPIGAEADFQRSANARHPALLRLQAMAGQAEQGVRAQEARLKPQVFLFGQRDLYRRDALLTDADWVFGVGLKYDLLSGSDRPRQVSAARGQLEQVEAGRREAENRITIEVTRAWNQLQSAREQFRLLESSIAQAVENLRLQELSFREGQATSLDVIDARLHLASARVERVQAAYQYDVALAQLLRVSGQLDQLPHYINRARKVTAQ